MSKPTERFVLRPADVYFNQGEREREVINGGLIAQPSVATSSESKRATFSKHDLKKELIKEEPHWESHLEVTTKASQLDVLDRLAPSKPQETPDKNNLWTINNKIQTTISKLIELGFSSSKLEKSRIKLQSFIKNSRLSLNELFEVQLEGSSSQVNLLAFLSDLQVANKKFGEESPNVLRNLKSALNTSYQMSRQKRWCHQRHKAIRPRVHFLQLRPSGSSASDEGQEATVLITLIS